VFRAEADFASDCRASTATKYMLLELVLQLSGCEGLARMAELELDTMEFPSTSRGKKR